MKKMQNLSALWACGAVLAIVACDSPGTGRPATDATDAEVTPIEDINAKRAATLSALPGADDPATLFEGAWRSRCIPFREFGNGLTVIFKGTAVLSVLAFFPDSNCAATPSKEIWTGRRVILSGESITTNGMNANFTIVSDSLVVLDPALAIAYRDQRFCDRDSWTAGVPEEVTGRTCEFVDAGSDEPLTEEYSFGTTGSTSYELIAVSNDTLYFGDRNEEHSGDTEETRPVSLDYDLPFQRL